MSLIMADSVILERKLLGMDLKEVDPTMLGHVIWPRVNFAYIADTYLFNVAIAAQLLGLRDTVTEMPPFQG
jgi:hypothetical protein